MMDVRDFVRDELPSFSDPANAPYVMNHGGLGPITSKSFIDRKNEISLFLSTRKFIKAYKVMKALSFMFLKATNGLFTKFILEYLDLIK